MNNTQNPGTTLESRGLPLVLFNNDSDDLTWPGYPEYHADGLWVPDGPNLPLPKLDSVEDYLALRIGPLAKTKTQGLSYCGNFGVPVWDLRRDHIAALGDDPLQPILQFWKRDGRTFFFSMRMNDIHHVFREWTVSWNDFRRTHWHLLQNPPTDQEWESKFVPWLAGKAKRPAIEWSSLAFDYSHAEVRTHYLDTLREACRRYELDGVEFDWIRHPYLFREGEVNAATMTAFVHEARVMLDEVAKRRGHAMRLVTRVPVTPAQALAIGLDVEAWLQAGWLDAIIAGEGTTFSSSPLEQWVALAHRYGVPVYGSLERRPVHHRYGSPEVLRAAIATLWEKGADGLYFFNFYLRHEMPLLDEFADRARLARLPKEYFLESRADELPHMPSTITPGSCARNCAACAIGEDCPLPLEITPGQAAKVSVFIADEPGQAANLHLECTFNGGPLALAACGIQINGRQVEGLKPDHDNQVHVKGDCEFPSHWTLFGPTERGAADPDVAAMTAIPTELAMAGKLWPAQTALFRRADCRPWSVDLGALLGGVSEGKSCWLMTSVSVEREMEVTFGASADWWMQWWLNGQAIYDTLVQGNSAVDHGWLSHRFTVRFQAGRNLLAVKVVSGSGGYCLAAGGPRELPQLSPLTVSCASASLATLLRRGDNEFVFTSSVPAVLTALSVRVTP